ncbi:MAG: di-trans,poly-cis-decaprenylcistransferase [Gammaproteobacteria bacterium RBG_16_57_12]|nr:MAG: di-trans,poly-cis-decaprenylcistransferase [Gammaproteobacteria bacterium RBG_16_57_12]
MSNAQHKTHTPPARIPRHVAIIMDGNGRWAKQRKRPRIFGHQAGVESVRGIVKQCAAKGIEILTLFAFSSENWRRPEEEVGLLMDLFLIALEREANRLHKNNVRLRIIGERSAFSDKLQRKITEAEQLTRDNTGLIVVVAANYGGRWDISQAAQTLAQQVAAGALELRDITPERLAAQLSLADLPEPDLFIRTGGEQRISNFLLWQLAYTELYFTEVLWPDFDETEFEQALNSFAGRQRRFGRTGDQVEQEACSNNAS